MEGVSPVKIPQCGSSPTSPAPKKSASANAGSVSKNTDRTNTEPGWSPVKRATTSVAPVKDKLVNDGWSVPIVTSIADLNIAEPVVCLVSSAEARKAVKELTGVHALAILSSANTDNRGQELHVLMEDISGRVIVRRRFLLQLGIGAVTYMDGKPKKQFKPDSTKVVISFAKIHTESEAWTYASKHPREAVKKWLELRSKIAFMDVSQPTRPAGSTDSLQAIVFMPANSLVPALRASGLDGVFVRPFIENDQDRLLYRAAPFALDISLAAAVRAFGVVPFARGFGVRVKSSDYHEIPIQIQPEKSEHFSGKR